MFLGLRHSVVTLILFTLFPPSFFSISSLSPLIANVCDDEFLLCQNGGTCFQNQKCLCLPEYKGVLCEQLLCEGERGCSGASASYVSLAAMLSCLLANALLRIVTACWATTRTAGAHLAVVLGPSTRRANLSLTVLLHSETLFAGAKPLVASPRWNKERVPLWLSFWKPVLKERIPKKQNHYLRKV